MNIQNLKTIIPSLIIGLTLSAGVTFAAWATDVWNPTDNWVADGGVISAQKLAENLEYLKYRDSTPSGAVMAFDLASCPAGWSTFTQVKGRVVVGLNASDSEFNVLGETGGEKTHTLTTSEMPQHTHTLYTAAAISTGGGPGYYNGYTGTVGLNSHAGNSGYAGSGAPHNNLQPYIAMLYCKKS